MKRIEVNLQTGERWELDLTAEEIAALPPAPAPAVPQSVSKRQAVQVLILDGLLAAVEQKLSEIPGIEGELARAEWRESNTVERDRPLVVQMVAALELTPEQGDQLFIRAAAL